jgi:exonuclease III
MGNLISASNNPDYSKADHATKLNINSKSSAIHHSIKIYHQNVCGLRYKVDELLNLLYPDFPHFICITEHHLSHNELNAIVVENYKLGASYCRRNALKGGSCAFVLNHLNCVALNVEPYCLNFDIEPSAVKIQADSSFIILLVVYRAPFGNFLHFLQKLDMVLKSLYNTKTEFIICDDFNIDYLTDNNKKSQLNSILTSYNLFSVIDFPTIQNSSKSAIDNIFIDYWRVVTYEVLAIPNGISDHDAQLIMIHDLVLPIPPKVCLITRKIDNVHLMILIIDLVMRCGMRCLKRMMLISCSIPF